MSFVKAISIGTAACFVVLASAAQSLLSPGTSRPFNPLVWDATEKSAELPVMTNIAHFTFWVTNTAFVEAVILATETSCDCTVAEAARKLPWGIAPGDGGALNVTVNTLGKFGLLTKTVAVQTSYGTQELTIRVKIPLTPAPFNVSARQRDVMAAQADRQAVFRNHCAPCHATPALAQTGETLFERACGICHTAQHRAEMVPELARLNRETPADYWRTNILFGKPGSLMPAFAKSEGGILDTNQVESLVEFLLRQYPSKKASATNGAPSSPINHAAGPPPPVLQAK